MKAYQLEWLTFAVCMVIVALILGTFMGCATQSQPVLPTYQQMQAAQPPPAVEAPKIPKVTGAMILARQPKEVQMAIKNYGYGQWPTWSSDRGKFVPYTVDMEPVEVDCAPHFHTDIYLEPDEAPTGVAAGDSERWMIAPATEPGSAGGSVIVVKCKDSVDDQHHPLVGDASIYTSAGRTYPLLLKAHPRTDLRWVRFYDPAQIIAAMNAADRTPVPTPQELDPLAPAQTAKLNCSYKVDGGARSKGVRACDDGTRTYIDLPVTPDPTAPVVVSGNGDQVNSRMRGSRIIADGLFAQLTLLFGDDKVLVERGTK